MFRKERLVGAVVFRVLSIRQSSDGPVCTVRVSFEGLDGKEFTEIGRAEIICGVDDKATVVKATPVYMDLCRLAIPGLDQLVAKYEEQRKGK